MIPKTSKDVKRHPKRCWHLLGSFPKDVIPYRKSKYIFTFFKRYTSFKLSSSRWQHLLEHLLTSFVCLLDIVAISVFRLTATGVPGRRRCSPWVTLWLLRLPLRGGVSRNLPTLGSGLPRLGCGFPPLTAACAIHGAAFSPLQVCLAAAGAAHGSPCGCYVCPFVPPRDPFVA